MRTEYWIEADSRIQLREIAHKLNIFLGNGHNIVYKHLGYRKTLSDDLKVTQMDLFIGHFLFHVEGVSVSPPYC